MYNILCLVYFAKDVLRLVWLWQVKGFFCYISASCFSFNEQRGTAITTTTTGDDSMVLLFVYNGLHFKFL